MRRLLKYILLVVGCSVLTLVGVGGYAIYQIDRSEKASRILPSENILKEGAVELTDLAQVSRSRYLAHLAQNSQPATEYVVKKFQDHDVVLLGEYHQIQDDCLFIASLVAPLYHRAGVRVLAMETIKHKRTRLANRLVTARYYDESAVRDLFRDLLYWGFQEYMDILRAVWEVNSKLPDHAAKVRILGLGPDFDWDDITQGRLVSKLDDLWLLYSSEQYMADLVAAEAIEKGEKALVQIGYHHSFTHYREPKVRHSDGTLLGESEMRMGFLLQQEYKDRVFQICLNQSGHLKPGLYLDSTKSLTTECTEITEKSLGRP